MEPDKLLSLSIDYLSDYTKVFFDTLSKPRLLFAPILSENKVIIQSSIEQKSTLNPKLFSYAIISMIIGLTIQSVIPSWNDIRINIGNTTITGFSASTGVVILGVWLIYATVASAIFYKVLRGVSFFELISVNLQIISTQYVLSCFLTLIWAAIYRNPFFHQFIIYYSPQFIRLLGGTPAYLYFGLQFLLLILFVPTALINTYNQKKTVYLYIAVFALIIVTVFFVIFNFGLWSTSSLTGAPGEAGH